jgi:V/A-type H+-transporting ATPase subunit E
MTDNKLQELIETLKKQGVESGEMASRKITEGAQKKADEIITRAKSDADGILARAKEDADRQRKQLHSSMEIAATQLISDLKRTIEQNLISLPLRKKLSEHLSDTAFLKELIAACVREYIKDTGRVELDILVSKEQQEKLGDFAMELIKALPGKSDQERLVLNLQSGEVSFGFIIGKADNAVRLDFTDEAFLELFLRYLSHRFREFFKTIDVKELSNP